ncbi:hypothetical protein [Hyphomicrobium sp. ghe19]|uniref:hypothetical protein n=1 Tax=Hyphomicrobium sp. ghe19 TaxID=2682968 RepID=UPI0013676560|nr:DNA polymerase I [Hyphomicrobium sp. ghe19]
MAKKPVTKAVKAATKKTTKKPTTLLIDGDEIIWKVGTVCEVAFDWGDGIWTLHSDEAEGIKTLVDTIEGLKKKLEADSVIICLSSPTNFRKKLDETYKGNRKDVRKPLLFKALRNYLLRTYVCNEVKDWEADDVMGTLATHPENQGKVIIVSQDKDMKTIPCKLYREGKLRDISVEEAHRFHMWQTLVGDRADGFSGCPKVGEATADKILDCDVEEMWPRVVEAFVKAGLTKKDALLQARLARILQHGDYNQKTKKVKLWTK